MSAGTQGRQVETRIPSIYMRACLRAYVRACVRACVCVRVCTCVDGTGPLHTHSHTHMWQENKTEGACNPVSA